MYNFDAPEALDTTGGVSEKRWPLPTPDLQHLGTIVVLRTDAPDLQVRSAETSHAGLRVTGWGSTSQALADLVFCKLRVHKRTYYRMKIEQLVRSISDDDAPTMRTLVTPLA